MMQTIADRRHVMELLEGVDDRQLAVVIHLLEVLRDLALRPVPAAPPDDEPITEEDARRLRGGREWFAERGGQGIAMSDVLADFGLKAEDFPLNGENPV